MAEAKSAQSQAARMRLDKWLWAARFYKTRSIAKQAIDGGKVHCDGTRAKPGKEAYIGLPITLRQGFDEKTVIVKGLSQQRRGAAEAQLLYEETEESINARERLRQQRKLEPNIALPRSRPSKRDRRLIHQFKQKQTDE